MTKALLKNADWTKRSSRFYALVSSFAIGALISWAHGLTRGFWHSQFAGSAGLHHSSLTDYLEVMAATLAWGVLVSMLLALGSRREVSSQKVLGFAVLACFIGWDAGWRMMEYALGWHGPC